MDERAEARGAYQDFLTLWKDAVPDIPILIAAKAEYAKLQWLSEWLKKGWQTWVSRVGLPDISPSRRGRCAVLCIQWQVECAQGAAPRFNPCCRVALFTVFSHRNRGTGGAARKVARRGSSSAKELEILKIQVSARSRFIPAVLCSFKRWYNCHAVA